MIFSFLIAFLQRIMSGAASYFGYSKRIAGLIIVSILMIALPFFVVNNHWIFIAFLIVNLLTVGMKAISFIRNIKGWIVKYEDIHFWEDLVTGGFMIYLTLTGHNILMLICSVYPSLIIHKGLIDLGNGLPFLSNATDDATGKTYSIPLLGIKVNRSSTNFRLIAAGISIIIASVVLITKIDVSIYLF